MLDAAAIKRILQHAGHRDMTVGAGGAMVLHGLRHDTNDIDVSVPPGTAHGHHEAMDTHIDPAPLPSEPMEGVNARVMTHGSLLDFYKKLNRPKDQK